MTPPRALLVPFYGAEPRLLTIQLHTLFSAVVLSNLHSGMRLSSESSFLRPPKSSQSSRRLLGISNAPFTMLHSVPNSLFLHDNASLMFPGLSNYSFTSRHRDPLLPLRNQSNVFICSSVLIQPAQASLHSPRNAPHDRDFTINRHARLTCASFDRNPDFRCNHSRLDLSDWIDQCPTSSRTPPPDS